MLIGESGRKVVIFTIELPRGQLLSLVFTNLDMNVGLVYEYTTVEPVVVQREDDRNTLLVFAESENIELCLKLQCVEIWLGHSGHTGCDIATLEQIMLGEGLQWLEREENALGETVSAHILKATPESQFKYSCPRVKCQNLVHLVGITPRREKSYLNSGFLK